MSDKITIGRWWGQGGSGGITVTIEDDKGRMIYRGDMGLEEFARCITAQANCHIEREFPKAKGGGSE